MAWFWGSRKAKDEEEESEEEEDEEEYTDDDDDDDYDSEEDDDDYEEEDEDEDEESDEYEDDENEGDENAEHATPVDGDDDLEEIDINKEHPTAVPVRTSKSQAVSVDDNAEAAPPAETAAAPVQDPLRVAEPPAPPSNPPQEHATTTNESVHNEEGKEEQQVVDHSATQEEVDPCPVNPQDDEPPLLPPTTTQEQNDNHQDEADQDEEEDDDDDDDPNIPHQVLHNNNNNDSGPARDRVHSTVTLEDDLLDDDEEEEEDEEAVSQDDDDEEDDDEDEAATSLQDNQSLFLMAAEHDRTDILNKVLAQCTDETDHDTTNTSGGVAMTKNALLHEGGLPALHVAVWYGSVHAVQCLLRVGANPSLRPDTTTTTNGDASTTTTTTRPELPPSIPPQTARAMHHQTAWDLLVQQHSANHNNKTEKYKALEQAFCTEALRCMGSNDDVQRLQELLSAGMPPTLELGPKPLTAWALDLQAPQCHAALTNNNNPTSSSHAETTTNATSESTKAEDEIHTNDNNNDKQTDPKPTTAVLDRPGTDGSLLESSGNNTNLVQLRNRLEEVHSLARALTMCLDNLAEEVAVGHGLLSHSGGASAALASHVKGLKTQRQDKQGKVQQLELQLQEQEEELQEWIQQHFESYDHPTVQEIWNNTTTLTNNNNNQSKQQQQQVNPKPHAPTTSTIITTSVDHSPDHSAPSKSAAPMEDGPHHKDHPDTTQQQQEQEEYETLQAQLQASQIKVRKLRVAITDLSEEHGRNMTEVERRGLTGGIQLVRTLREELRTLEFDHDRLQQAQQQCQRRLQQVQDAVAVQQQEREQQSEREPAKEPQPQQSEPKQNEQQQQPRPERQPPPASLPPPEQPPNDTEGQTKGKGQSVPVEETSSLEAASTSSAANSLTTMDANEEPLLQPAQTASESSETSNTKQQRPTSTSHNNNKKESDTVERPKTSNGTQESPPQTTNTPSEPTIADRGAVPLSSMDRAASISGILTESERIATGQSTAIALRPKGGTGYFPVGLWQILMRIMGIPPLARQSGGMAPQQQPQPQQQPSRSNSTNSSSSARTTPKGPPAIII